MYSIIVGVIIFILTLNCETFSDVQSNKNIIIQDNNNQNYVFVPFNNLKLEYKNIFKNIIINNYDFMKKENSSNVTNNNIFTKNPLVLIKDTDVSNMTENLDLKFNIEPNDQNVIFTPVINNTTINNNYVYNDYGLLYYAYNGNNILETNKNIYLNKLNDNMYTIINDNNNIPVKIIM
jgi:hypothetical protein